MIGALILGLVAGALGKLLVPGKQPGGILGTIGLGLVGALVGYFIFTKGLGIGDDDAFDLGGLLSAVIGVVVVLFAYRAVAGRSAAR
ncbi:GlsB/YeaQ/YmgE family stress response membrane protein [Patulibacter minatonensis]|uniref:GlsB/YeaQ/YmgE family stress response membrane protein n=1 Tax=Patulibacter minatonensis TaxID=298163 RepID=UPI00047E5095|nr:GlsB/YeaQ/YmgE family stress response membrane protein [Patulibacter minatonensis]